MNNNFYQQIADILETDSLAPTDTLADFPEWDSLSVLSVIAMIGSNYGVQLSAADLRGVGTAEQLYSLVAARTAR